MVRGRRHQLAWLLLAAALAACGAEREPSGSLRGRNVLVTLVDACAAGHLATYGYARPTTPYLDRLAAESVLFEDVSAAAPYTLASVASLMTGEAVDVHGVTAPGQVIDPALTTLAEAFRSSGYATQAYSTNAHVRPEFGFDQGFERFERIPPTAQSGDLGEHHLVPPALEQALFELFAEVRERPFFAYAHVLPPHAPYNPPPQFRARFAPRLADARLGSLAHLTPLTASRARPDPAEQQAIIDLYDAGVAYVDSRLAEIGAALRSSGRAEDTLWIIVSDHGEAFGEHGVYQHAKTVYREMLAVPLVMRFPGGEHGGLRIAGAVGLVDLMPTLMDLCALGGPRPAGGRSLAPLLAGRSIPPRALVARTAGPGETRALRLGALVLIQGAAKGAGSAVELYDLASDPGQKHNLARERRDDLERLERELATQGESAAARRAAVRTIELAPEVQAELEDIGYGGGARDE